MKCRFKDHPARTSLIAAGLLAAFLLLGGGLAKAVNVTFGWDAVPGVAGYNLYQGTRSQSYDRSYSAGRNTQITVSNLTAGTTYYFAVTSYDSNAVESAYSAEFSFAPAAIGVPSISITSPKTGTTINGQTVDFTVQANANGHTLKKVQYFSLGGQIGESSAAPYSFTWANAQRGIVPVIARLVYDNGFASDSLPVTLYIVPPGSASSIAANNGSISLPFVVNLDGSISQPALTTLLGSGRAAYSFTVPQAGDYIITGNVLAADTSANSFYINVDAEPTDPMMIWNLNTSSSYTNQPVTWQGVATATKVFTLAAGQHQIIVRGREANTYLKGFTVSPAYGRLQLSSYNGQVFLTGSGVANRTYEVQASSNYKSWNVIGTATADSTGAISYFDTAPMAAMRIYRVRDTGR